MSNRSCGKYFGVLLSMLALLLLGIIPAWANPGDLADKSDTVVYRTFDTESNISTCKEWTIQFSDVVREESVSSNQIKVINGSSGETMPNPPPQVLANGKTVKLEPPISGYAPDTKYCILVAGVTSQTGQELALPAKKEFITTGDVQSFENTKATARTELQKAITDGTANSATVAIMDNGRLIYSEGFGLADRENNIAVDKNTVFNIGSVSKMFLATAIMLLVDEGKVDLDNPVTNYLPEFTMADERYKDITVRMLLNHSSGLPGTTFWNNVGSQYNQDIYSQLLTTFTRSTLKHRPGELAIYCNDGYTLAEMIVAEVTGQSYGDFLAQRIFQPLAMTHTGLGVGQLTEELTPAKFYRPDGKSEPLEIVSLQGSGGLSSTAEDLCLFAAAFFKHSAILSAQSLEEMLQRQPSELQGKLRGDTFPFGLGWDFAGIAPYSANNTRLYGKTGGTGHYSAMLYTLPSHKISMAVIASNAQCNTSGIAFKIISAYLAEKGLVITGEEQTDKEPIQAQPIPADLLIYEGYYQDLGNTLRIALDAEKGLLNLYAIDDGNELPLFSAVHNGSYFYDGDNRYYFTTVDGTDYFVAYSSVFDFHNIRAEKIPSLANPLQLTVPMDNQLWLRRNVKPTEGSLGLSTHIELSRLIPGLPGYVDFSGLKKIKSANYAGHSVKSIRDLTELRLIEENGATMAWLSGAKYMPAEQAQPLKAGGNIASIDGEGQSQWFKAGFETSLGLEIPDWGRVIVFDQGDILYDSMVHSGEIFVPAGSLIEVLGEPGDLFKLTANQSTNY